MKKLIFKFIAFCVLFLISIIVLFYSVNNNISNNVNFKINQETVNVIFGHSHPETAFNDSLISKTENFAKSGESYYYMYPKVLRIIKQNKNVKNVFIEFTNNLVDESMNNWIWGDEYITSRYLTYSPFISVGDQLILLRKNPKTYLEYFTSSLKTNFNRVVEKDYVFSRFEKFGGYNSLKESKLDSLIKANQNNPIKKLENHKISNVNIEYLEKIISLCKENNKKVYLIRSPQHSLSPELNNEDFFKEIILNRFKDVDFLDFNNFPLSSIEYRDFGHINHKGAKVFSLWFDSIIKEGILNNRNKNQIINEKILNFDKKNRDELSKLFDKKTKENKLELFNHIIEKGYSLNTKHNFSTELRAEQMFFYTDDKKRYFLIEYNGDHIHDFLKDKTFGIHAYAYSNDKNKLPSWIRNRSENRITWNAEMDIISNNNRNYIILNFQKISEINNFKQIRIFLMNKEKYQGTIGNAFEKEAPLFLKVNGLNSYEKNNNNEEEDELTKIFISAPKTKIDHNFSEELKVSNIIFYSNIVSKFIALEYQEPYPVDFMKDKIFGIHGLAHKRDLNNLPDWVKEKQDNKLSWGSTPLRIKIDDKNYLILTLKKHCDIDEWKQIRVFLMDKEVYKGTIGEALNINNISFK
jgi:hypothetical protein